MIDKAKRESDKESESYCFLEKMRILKKQYESLRANKDAWVDELQERQELDGTLMDGLTDIAFQKEI